MKCSLVVVTAVALAARGSPARADDANKPSRLADVLAVAVRQAPELERAAMDLEVARATVQRTEGIEDVKLAASGGFTRFSVPGTVEDVTTGSLDLGRTLPTGGSFHITASTSKVGAGTTIGGLVYPPGVTTGVQFQLIQPLLRNLGLGTTRAPRYEAEARRDAAALDREARARELVRAIVDAYWHVALAHAELDIRKAALATADQQRVYTENAIRIGKVAKSELLAVQQVIAVRKQDLLAAELAITEQSLALRRLAGLEIGPDAIDVETEPLPAVKPQAVDARDTIARALAHSPTVAQAQATERAESARATAASNALLPQIDVGVGGGPLGVARTFTSSLDRLAAADGYQVGVTVTSSYALGRNEEHGQDRTARARVYKAKVDARDARAAIAADAARAVQLARAAAASLDLGDQAVDLAGQNVEAEIHRFEDKKATNFDVMLRQTDLELAKLRRAQAVVDYLSARARIGALTGAILGDYGIKLRDF